MWRANYALSQHKRGRLIATEFASGSPGSTETRWQFCFSVTCLTHVSIDGHCTALDLIGGGY